MGGRAKLIIKKGDVFGNLTAIKEVHPIRSRRAFLFKCKCGNEKELEIAKVKGFYIKTCGCKIGYIAHNKTHGMRHSRLYGIWSGMKNRCLNPNVKCYYNYGGRGITICNEWMDFQTFMKWAISAGYKDDLSIDRIDNSLGYSPDNCKWATKIQQCHNTRKVIKITYKGETKILSEWCRILKVPVSRVTNRIKLGWDLIDALTLPKGIKNYLEYKSTSAK